MFTLNTIRQVKQNVNVLFFFYFLHSEVTNICLIRFKIIRIKTNNLAPVLYTFAIK